MSANRLAAVIISMGMLVAGAFAQINEVSATVGRTFVSSQTIQNANFFNHDVHFGDSISVGGNYSRLFFTHSILGLSLEVPFAFDINSELNTGANLIPKSYRAFFVAPSARLNVFNAEAVSPWVSFGGGYAHYSMSDTLVYGGPNPGSSSTNTGVIQFGTGLDVFPWHKWGFRLEARDYWTGHPDLNVDTDRSRQHNYYVGGGVIFRF